MHFAPLLYQIRYVDRGLVLSEDVTVFKGFCDLWPRVTLSHPSFPHKFHCWPWRQYRWKSSETCTHQLQLWLTAWVKLAADSINDSYYLQANLLSFCLLVTASMLKISLNLINALYVVRIISANKALPLSNLFLLEAVKTNRRDCLLHALSFNSSLKILSIDDFEISRNLFVSLARLREFRSTNFLKDSAVCMVPIDRFLPGIGLLEVIANSIYRFQLSKTVLRHAFNFFVMLLLLTLTVFKVKIWSCFDFDATFVYRHVIGERKNWHTNTHAKLYVRCSR